MRKRERESRQYIGREKGEIEDRRRNKEGDRESKGERL